MIRIHPAGRLASSFLALALAGSLAGCVTSGTSLTSSAERLERSSYALEKNAYAEREDSRYRRDAVALAEEARDFRRLLTDSRADNADVRAAFSDLSRSYHALRDEVERSRSRDVERDFQPVTDAYLDIEREMDHPRRDRYARD